MLLVVFSQLYLWCAVASRIITYKAHTTLQFFGPTGVCLLDFLCSGIQFYLLLSSYFCFISFLLLDLYVLGNDALVILLVMFHVGVCCAVVSVPCSLVVTCWERADFLVVMFVVLCFVTFPNVSWSTSELSARLAL